MRRFFNINRYLTKLYKKKKEKGNLSGFFEMDSNWKQILREMDDNDKMIKEIISNLKGEIKNVNKTPGYWSP